MTLEDLIYTRLSDPDGPAAKLARYGDAPAIFYQAAPEDTATGWDGKRQYPRIDYTVDMQANPERHSCGILTLNIWCSEQCAPPEDLEPEVRVVMRDVFIQPDESPPYSLAWVRSDAFEGRSQANPATLVNGITVLFDLFAFPVQETTDPDPILAINEYVKRWAPDALVIGKDTLKRFQVATAAQPIFYFRLASLQLQRETNAVAWMDGVIAGYIYAPEETRLKWLKALVDVLSLDGEVTMLDTSPMFLRGIKADSAADPLTVGQLRLQIRFGLLRRPKYAHTLMNDYKAI